jgi:hypothetical protein
MTAIALLLLFPWQASATSPEASPCELIANPHEHSGRDVTVRGKLYWNREGGGLVFPECPGSLVTNGHDWEKGIAIDSIEESSPYDRLLLTRHLNDILHPLLPSVGGGLIEVHLTIRGRVGTRPVYTAKATGAKKKILFNGFGPFKVYPVALARVRVLDLHIREVKAVSRPE